MILKNKPMNQTCVGYVCCEKEIIDNKPTCNHPVLGSDSEGESDEDEKCSGDDYSYCASSHGYVSTCPKCQIAMAILSWFDDSEIPLFSDVCQNGHQLLNDCVCKPPSVAVCIFDRCRKALCFDMCPDEHDQTFTSAKTRRQNA